MGAATPTNTSQAPIEPVVRPVTGAKRGRPATASPDDVLALVTELYLDGQRVDVTVVAARLGHEVTSVSDPHHRCLNAALPPQDSLDRPGVSR